MVGFRLLAWWVWCLGFSFCELIVNSVDCLASLVCGCCAALVDYVVFLVC